jgi:hypothetical protein
MSQLSLKNRENIDISPIIKPFSHELNETRSDRSNDKLIYEATPFNEKSIFSLKDENSSVLLSTAQNILHETKPLIDRKVSFIQDEGKNGNKNSKISTNNQSIIVSDFQKKNILLNSSKDQSIFKINQEEESANSSNKASLTKKEKKKNPSKNWDDDYS